MGAWGYHTFDNDRACDWGYDLERVSDLSLVELAVAAVFVREPVEADVGCDALAAIETLARLTGEPGLQTVYTEVVDAWVATHPQPVPEALVERSRQALDVLLVPARSELAELWAETEDFQAWSDEVATLRARLSGI